MRGTAVDQSGIRNRVSLAYWCLRPQARYRLSIAVLIHFLSLFYLHHLSFFLGSHCCRRATVAPIVGFPRAHDTLQLSCTATGKVSSGW